MKEKIIDGWKTILARKQRDKKRFYVSETSTSHPSTNLSLSDRPTRGITP
jgi:hypothetical protein